MTKSFLTTAALVIAGSIAANAAWEGSAWDGAMFENTDQVEYSYQKVSTNYPEMGSFNYDAVYTTGNSNEVQRYLPGTVDFTQNARYEITFEATHFDYNQNQGDVPASVMLALVNDRGDVSLAFGNGANAMGRLGCKLGENIIGSLGQQNLTNSTMGSYIWTTQHGTNNGSMPYDNGTYRYTLIFETFADSTIGDKIFFKVENTATGAFSHFSILSSHLPAGGSNDQVFSNLSFLLVGDANNSSTAGQSKNGNTGAYLTLKDAGNIKTSFTSYTRTETVIPEPSAFGLLAGIGALALVASRRRRK